MRKATKQLLSAALAGAVLLTGSVPSFADETATGVSVNTAAEETVTDVSTAAGSEGETATKYGSDADVKNEEMDSNSENTESKEVSAESAKTEDEKESGSPLAEDGDNTVVNVAEAISEVVSEMREMDVDAESLEIMQEKLIEIDEAYTELTDEEQELLSGSYEALENAQASVDTMLNVVTDLEETGEISENYQQGPENSYRYMNGQLITEAEETAEQELYAAEAYEAGEDEVIVQALKEGTASPVTSELSTFTGETAASLTANTITKDQMASAVILDGIDVSYYQGTIDWAKVKAAGIDYAILRVGYGNDQTSQDDKQWERNVSECERLGIPYGVYIYSYATNQRMVNSEVQHVLRLLEGHNPEYPVYFDIEDNSQIAAFNEDKTGTLLSDLTISFCSQIEAAGYTPGVCTYLNFYNNYLKEVCTNTDYNRWVCAYSSSLNFNYSFSQWQYTSTGSVDGISGNVDRDYYYLAGTDNTEETHNASVTYRTHVQNDGWQGWKTNGTMSGTSGRALRLEGIEIKLEDADYSGSIQYRTHVQNIGWQDWKSNGTLSGTSGQALRLEAIQIKLTDEMAEKYDIYYRVHAQNFGWLGWAKNGASAGTAGYAYRLEGIEIVLTAKGAAAPGSTENAFKAPLISYKTHVQNVGWQSAVTDGKMSGTSGQALRLEGIIIELKNQVYSGTVMYRTHVQNIGWQDWVSGGTMSGTSGRALRLEGIQIRLTGEMAEKYDIYYRVHAQNFGWLGWAKNGESAGSEGYAYRLEGIQIQLVEKGGAAPGSTANAFYIKSSGSNSNNSSNNNSNNNANNNSNNNSNNNANNNSNNSSNNNGSSTHATGMSDANRAILRNMIGAFETGGQIYGNRDYATYSPPYNITETEVTITLGAYAFYGSNAQNLIKRILQTDPTLFRSIDTNQTVEKQLSDNWESIGWNPDETQKQILIKLISSDVGKKCQDEMFDEQTQQAITYCQTNFTNDTRALLMFTTLWWHSPAGAIRIYKKCGSDYSLTHILDVLKLDQSDSAQYQLGDTIFWRRRQMEVEWIEKYVVD